MLVGRGAGVGQGRVKGLLGSGTGSEVLECQGLVEVAVDEGLGDYLVYVGGTGLGDLTAELLYEIIFTLHTFTGDDARVETGVEFLKFSTKLLEELPIPYPDYPRLELTLERVQVALGVTDELATILCDYLRFKVGGERFQGAVRLLYHPLTGGWVLYHLTGSDFLLGCLQEELAAVGVVGGGMVPEPQAVSLSLGFFLAVEPACLGSLGTLEEPQT